MPWAPVPFFDPQRLEEVNRQVNEAVGRVDTSPVYDSTAFPNLVSVKKLRAGYKPRAAAQPARPTLNMM